MLTINSSSPDTKKLFRKKTKIGVKSDFADHPDGEVYSETEARQRSSEDNLSTSPRRHHHMISGGRNSRNNRTNQLQNTPFGSLPS